MSPGYRKYSQAYQKSAVHTMDQRKLIVMMYDGAIKFITLAIRRMGEQDRYGSHTNLSKAKSIIAELMASLNMDQGGDIAANLQKLYIYMFNELIESNINLDANKAEHVLSLLKELREAWKGLDVQSSPPGPQGGGGAPSGPGGSKRVNIQG